MSESKDALITEADVQAFKQEVNQGCFKDRVYELMEQEPELAFYVSERYAKTLDPCLPCAAPAMGWISSIGGNGE
jgi:hypothetical protein